MSELVSRFESVGVALPAQRLSSEALMRQCQPAVRLDLEAFSGIRERRVCGPGEDSMTLAETAARDCLARSRYSASDLDVVIDASISTVRSDRRLQISPAASLLLKQAIGAPQALHFDVSNACAGILTGVLLLQDMIRRGVIRCGMVASGEVNHSLSFNAAREMSRLPDPRLAGLTLGDAGAAVIVERAEDGEPGILASEMRTYSKHNSLCLGRPCATGPGGTIETDPVRLHRVGLRLTVPVLKRVLAASGLTGMPEIDVLIPHQTTRSALERVGEVVTPRVGGPPGELVDNLTHYGNTTTTTHFLALRRFLDEGRIERGQRVMLAGVASGLVVYALVMVADHLVDQHAAH